MVREEEAEELFDPNEDEELLEPWLHLKVHSPEGFVRKPGDNSSGDGRWWMVFARDEAQVHAAPSLESRVLGTLSRGDPVFGIISKGHWVKVDFRIRPPKVGEAQKLRDGAPNPGTATWMLWDGHDQGMGLLMMPLPHAVLLSKYSNTDVKLPRDAVTWTIDEVDVFLGSLGFVKPGRESSLLRCDKKLVRAVRGGATGLEYRIDVSTGAGGVFAQDTLEKGVRVEVCPLHEVDATLRGKSGTLMRLTVQMNGKEGHYAIVLGFGKLYSVRKRPTLHWGYKGDDEVVLWAAEDIYSGRELTVNFSQPPRPLEEGKKAPLQWQPPGQRGPGKLSNAGYVTHGESAISGRGVFVTKDCAAGELLESCPAAIMDTAAAEAMFDYRWGLPPGAENDQGHYYLPLGLGSLYNHSEQPNAKGRLDVGRSVLEFYSTEKLFKGQEVLVSYGDSYFDESFAGHKRSQLQHIDAPVAESGDTEMQKLVELQRHLIRVMSTKEYAKDIMRIIQAEPALRQTRRKELPKRKGLDIQQEMHSQIKQLSVYIREKSKPTLERFGYTTNIKGMADFEADLGRKLKGCDPSSEAFANFLSLKYLMHMYDPPPPEYWDMHEVEVILFGTQDDFEPEVIYIDVPKRAPCGYLKYTFGIVLQKFLPHLVTATRGGGFEVLRDWEPVPASRRLFITNVGDSFDGFEVSASAESTVPAVPSREALLMTFWTLGGVDEGAKQALKSVPKGADEGAKQVARGAPQSQAQQVEASVPTANTAVPLLSSWQYIWTWLQNPEAQYFSYNFKGSTFTIAGTWNDWVSHDAMQWDGHNFVYFMEMGKNGYESFQILADGKWETVFYPDIRDGSPWNKHTLQGPDDGNHGKNWTIGRARPDQGPQGTRYRIEFKANELGRPAKVVWDRFENAEVANRAEKKAKMMIAAAAEEREEKEREEAQSRVWENNMLLSCLKDFKERRRQQEQKLVARPLEEEEDIPFAPPARSSTTPSAGLAEQSVSTASAVSDATASALEPSSTVAAGSETVGVEPVSGV
mmetsp:Transcript_55150/g.118449  ORF Transcript_55150/g.118449 Transcript_55150/m.118449 type:complete len:1028 (-) Transcript_55150:29-3112(-)